MTAAPAFGPVVIAAGGTGGHVMPALALAHGLQSAGFAPALVTDRRGTAFGDELGGIACHTVRAGGLAGRGVIGALRGLIALVLGGFEARALLRRLAPSLAVGFGGYASVPPLVAAASLGVPTLVHEANAVLGRANRLLAPRARAIATAFPDTRRMRAADGKRATRTGNPVRPEIIAARDVPYPALDPSGPVRLLVVGGSQGARLLGRMVPVALARLDPGLRRRLFVAQQCRPEDLEDARRMFAEASIEAEVAPFFDDVGRRLAASHLVIARAGASTVAELACAGRPAVLVPFARAIDNHQEANARMLEAAGGAWVMLESELSADSLAQRLAELLAGAELPAAAARARAFGVPDASERLVALARGIMHPKPEAEAA